MTSQRETRTSSKARSQQEMTRGWGQGSSRRFKGVEPASHTRAPQPGPGQAPVHSAQASSRRWPRSSSWGGASCSPGSCLQHTVGGTDLGTGLSLLTPAGTTCSIWPRLKTGPVPQLTGQVCAGHRAVPGTVMATPSHRQLTRLHRKKLAAAAAQPKQTSPGPPA